MATRLSVNINKVALLRNSRGGNIPDLVKFAKDCERFGAEGITVHPRPDERHIRYNDLLDLKEIVTTEFNIEGYPSERFLKKIEEIIPDQCTLVPDPPGVLTSNEGWDTFKHKVFLQEIISRLQEKNIRVSLFLEADEKAVEGAKNTGTDRIEFYTGEFAHGYLVDRGKAVKAHTEASKLAKQLQVGVNAGHDLNLANLKYYKSNVHGLLEVSIGHALIRDALYFGIQNTIQLYLRELE
jgi:pyridoxine 5-phosphate synthase